MSTLRYRLLAYMVLLAAGLTTAHAEPLRLATTDGTQIGVEFFTPRSVRITKVPEGRSATLRPSLVVTAVAQQDVAVQRRESERTLTLSSEALTVSIDKRTGRVAFAERSGKALTRELDYAFEPRTAGPDSGAYRVTTAFALAKDEPIYGVGTLQNGRLSRRDTHVLMEQSNLEDYQGVVQSIRGWGIYWDNYSRTRFDSPAEGVASPGGASFAMSSEVGDGVDYYFMLGGSADGVIAEMRALSGQVPMFPLWTYGFWQSKERYKSSRELLDVVRRHRELHIPLDGIVQDWQYWGSNYTWNAMDFLHDDFLDGRRMIDEVHRLGAHFMISIWASFGPMTQQYRELDSLGLLYDFQTWPQSGLSQWPPRMDYPSGVRVYDAFSPAAREVYWRHLTRLLEAGTDAWWMDSTDPDFFDARDGHYDHPAGDGTWRRYRNAFPLVTVGGVYDAQRALRSASDTAGAAAEKRVFIMTRSAWAGQQRYGSGLWSGDVRSSWDVLRRQIPLGLNYTLTGCPNFNTDIGGFFCGAYNTRGSGSAPRNPQFRELYVRWMQYGLFCPVFRSHGTDCSREVWEFGREGEPVYDALVSTIRLRYRLLPYLYATAWQVTSAGGSYMRPLLADFAADRRTWDLPHEFLFGRSILAAPVVEPQYTPEDVDRTRPDADGAFDPQGLDGWSVRQAAATADGYPDVDFTGPRSWTAYLPKGTVWYDFHTGTAYRGGRDVTVGTSLVHVPMFVRAGSIVPLAPEAEWVGQRAWDDLELRVYPGADGDFTLYEDEGDNYNYERGLYATIPMRWDDARRTLTLGARQGSYPGMLEERSFTVVLPDGTARTVRYDGAEAVVRF